MFACVCGDGENPWCWITATPQSQVCDIGVSTFCLLHDHKLEEPFRDPLKIYQQPSDKKTKARFEFLTAFYEDEILPGYDFVSTEILGLLRPRRDREGTI